MRVAASRSLSWFVEYRPGAGGRRISKKRFYFGSREFTPEQARQTAKELLASVALGEDPMADRQHDRQSLTFREFAERYLSEEAEAKLKPGTIANYRIAIRKHANPEIGRIKLDTISNSDLSRVHSENRQDKANDRQPGYGVHLVDLSLRRNLQHRASRSQPNEGNPGFSCRIRRERFLSSEELARLGEAIREAETDGTPYDIDESSRRKARLQTAEQARQNRCLYRSRVEATHLDRSATSRDFTSEMAVHRF